jgi:small redox-active disulfide protein 2
MTRIEVLGPGCRRCTDLDALVREVVAVEHLDATVRYVSDPAEIVGRGFFMRTPGLVIDGVVVAVGRVPSSREISSWLHTPPVQKEISS